MSRVMINESAIRQARESGDIHVLATELSTAATAALTLKDYPVAVRYYHEAVTCHDRLRHWSAAADLCDLLWGVYRRMDAMEQAAAAKRECERYRALDADDKKE